MNWDDTKYFLTVARTGQMLAAANRLGVSQAKVSRRITGLENALDCLLFDRSTVGCKLTDEGLRLLETAERIETEFEQFQSRNRSTKSHVEGVVRIGAPDGFGVAYLSSKLHLLSKSFPKLTVELVPVPQRFSLSHREADIAIMIGRPEKGRLRARKLTDYTLGLYASQTYLSTVGTPTELSDLKQYQLIGYVDDLLFTQQLNYTFEFCDDWQSSIRISSALGQYEAVCSGGGIGVLHDFIASKTTNLVPLFPEKKILRTYWTVWHENMKDTRRISIVTKFLDEIVRADRNKFNKIL